MQRPCNWNTESHREPRMIGTGERYEGSALGPLGIFVFIPRTQGDNGSVLEKGITQVFREYVREVKGKHLVVTYICVYS